MSGSNSHSNIAGHGQYGSRSDRGNNERGKIASVLAAVAGLMLVAVVLPFFIFGQIVPPDKIGVRQNYLTFGLLPAGFVDKGLPPGLHWKIPFVSQIHLLPATFQLIDFNNDLEKSEFPQVEITSANDPKIRNDIIFVVRLFKAPGQGNGVELPIMAEGNRLAPLTTPIVYEHNGPRVLFDQYSGSMQTFLQRFADEAVGQLQNKLGSLEAGEYYKPIGRETLVLEAGDSLNRKWAKSGLQIWGTLLRRFEYESAQKEEEIFQKALQEIKVSLNSSNRKLKEAEAKTEETRAFWDAEISKLQANGKAEADILISEGEKEKVTKIAQGDLLVDKAEAEITSAKNNLYTELKGAEVYLAKKMAPLLTTLQGGVVADVDPYNVDAWINKLTGKQVPNAE
ncbi:MAG: SPFH domain-containing protein [bacterium]|nr:SPFH domain-containing protein [bacterium]